VPAAGAAVLAAAAVAGWFIAPAGGSWFLRAVTSRLFLFCGLIALLCAAGLAAIGRMLWAIGARARPARRGEQGAAILEFVLVLPFALMLILIMVQSMLLMTGNLCVHYSAYCAARSAIVAIPDDLSPAEPPNELGPPDASGKIRRIHLAAVWALMPVSCGSRDIAEAEVGELTDGLDRFFSSYGKETPPWVHAYLGRKMRYADENTLVEIEPPEEDETYAHNEDIGVKVTHTFYMSVPYANKLFSYASGGVELDFAAGEYGMVMRATSYLTNEGVRDWVEIEKFPPEEDEGGDD